MSRSGEEKGLVEGTADAISSDVATRVNALALLDAARLRAEWRRFYRTEPPRSLSRDLVVGRLSPRPSASPSTTAQS